jgi:PST family polysaccharide transporter
MGLVRTSAWNGVAVAIRMSVALVLNKVLAVYVGPAGYAVIGQFQNLMGMLITFATGAVGPGVTKVTAEHFDDDPRQRALWRTAGTLTLLASVIASSAIVAFRKPLARLFLQDEALSGVFLWLAASLTLISLNALLLAILNGKKEVRRYVVSNIAGALLGLPIIGILAWQYGLYGALIALSVTQAVVFFVTLQQTITAPWFSLRDLAGQIDKGHLRTLGKFVLMATTTAVAMPLSQIVVRNHLGAEFGWDYAGYWDASWRISTLYLTLVTTALTLYYLPRIAEIRSWPELREEIKQAYRIVLPLVAGVGLVMFLARDLIIHLLFTADFVPMRRLFAWQIAGDIMKIGSWLIAFLMIGKGQARSYMATEIVSAVSFPALTWLFTEHYGFKGVAIAHFANYLIYWVLVYRLTVATEARRRALFR